MSRPSRWCSLASFDRGCSLLLLEKRVHRCCRRLRKEAGELLLAAEGNRGAHQVFDRSFAFDLQPPLSAIGHSGTLSGIDLRIPQVEMPPLDVLPEQDRHLKRSLKHQPHRADWAITAGYRPSADSLAAGLCAIGPLSARPCKCDYSGAKSPTFKRRDAKPLTKAAFNAKRIRAVKVYDGLRVIGVRQHPIWRQNVADRLTRTGQSETLNRRELNR